MKEGFSLEINAEDHYNCICEHTFMQIFGRFIVRKKFETQTFLFETPIPELEFPDASRNTLYPALKALKWLYQDREEICRLISLDLAQGKSSRLGANGMSGWQVLVIAVIRFCHKKSFDDVEFYCNEVPLVRTLLELAPLDTSRFSSKTLQQNFALLDPKTVDKINELVCKKALDEGIENGKEVRSDSFVCKRPIHYPTDQSVLWDATRVLLRECFRVFDGGSGFRQSRHLMKKGKSLLRDVGQSKRGGGKGKDKRVKKAYRELVNFCEEILFKFYAAADILRESIAPKHLEDFDRLVWHAVQVDQALDLIKRRVFCEETIENSDKLLSVFEWETELINRGKFPVAHEFGHRVMFSEGKSGLIIDYSTREAMGDLNEMEFIFKRLVARYGKLDLLTADKGFWRKGVREEFKEKCGYVAIAKKGKLTSEEKEFQSTEKFQSCRRWRSGVESLISCTVRTNGLGRCADKSMKGFLRWVGLGVLARNLITLGRILKEDSTKAA